MDVKVCFTECIGAGDRDALINALQTAGLEVAAPAKAAASNGCVIVFRTSLAEALDLVRVHGCLLPERVLAIALDGESVRHGAAFRLLEAGAADVFTPGPLAMIAEKIAGRLARWRAVDALLASDAVQRSLVGASAAWSRVLRLIVEVASFTDAPVLITGETGTGKELVSRLIHDLSATKAKRDLVVLDCTTIVPELSGSEFFGHEKGSFTGAVSARNGAFALADQGTLFLDEVGELSLPLQAELLRVVQEHTYKRVGGSVWQSTAFRLVCATNRDLSQERDEGRFRSDLFYRISGWTFHLPPLRERREDIMPLVRHFLAEHLPSRPELDEPVREHLLAREFPGNVRELRQLVARIAHRYVGPGPVTIGDLGCEVDRASAGAPDDWRDRSFHQSIAKAVAMGVGLKEIGRIAEDAAVQLAIGGENGSLQNAARRLGVTDRALQLRRASQRAPRPNAKSP
jgi:transcriptional regulator with GAF, ATPase, and Fis domain